MSKTVKEIYIDWIKRHSDNDFMEREDFQGETVCALLTIAEKIDELIKTKEK